MHRLRSVDNLFVVVQEFKDYQFKASKVSYSVRQPRGCGEWAVLADKPRDVACLMKKLGSCFTLCWPEAGSAIVSDSISVGQGAAQATSRARA